MYNIIDIARLTINKMIYNKTDINITRLQKYLYIIYGTYLVLYDKTISSEPPSCFETGPLFKTIQRDYKKNILNLNKQHQLINKIKNDKNLNKIIDNVINHFSKYEAYNIALWTMEENNAWSKAEKESDRWGNELNDNDIKEDFKKILKI